MSKVSKGISMVVAVMVAALIGIGIMAAIHYIRSMAFWDVHVMVVEAGVERHAINLAQVLLSSDKLNVEFPTEKSIPYRGIFDKEKIEQQFVKGSELSKEIGYPNSMAIIGVEDLDTGELWTLGIGGPVTIEGLKITSFLDCLISKIKIDHTIFFRVGFVPGFPSFWENYDVVSCIVSEASNYGAVVRYFPVAIKSGDEVHLGKLAVTVMEFWATEVV